MQVIRGKAPLRLSFCGGGTDLEPYSNDKGGVTLSTTIDKFAYGTLIPRKDQKIKIISKDYGLSVNSNADDILPLDGELNLIKAAVNRLSPNKGFDLIIECDAPPGTGLGSSGTVAVLVIGLILEYMEKHASPYRIAEMAYKIEIEDLKITVGRQDQYAATFGGFNLIEYSADTTLVAPLRIMNQILNELESNLILCFTKEGRSIEDPVNIEVEKYIKGDKLILSKLDEMKKLTYIMKNQLLLGNVEKFIDSFCLAGKMKIKNLPIQPSPTLSKYIDILKKRKVRAFKPLGAAGGGYLAIFSDYISRKGIINSLQDQGALITPVRFTSTGMQVWRSKK